MKSFSNPIGLLALAGASLAAVGCSAMTPRPVHSDPVIPTHMAKPAAAPAPTVAAEALPVSAVPVGAAEPLDAAPAAGCEDMAAQADPALVAAAGAVPEPGDAGGVPAPAPWKKSNRTSDVPREFLHFTQARVRAGELAPDFTLPQPDGSSAISLSSLRDKPTVLVFGSLTCDRFRSSAPEVMALYKEFGAVANFLMVYVREAHASDEWVRPVNEYVGIEVKQPVRYEERTQVAQTCTKRLKVPFPMVVDGMDDAVSTTYGAWPERLYIIDTDGRIAYMGGQGPAGFLPGQVRTQLLHMNVSTGAATN